MFLIILFELFFMFCCGGYLAITQHSCGLVAFGTALMMFAIYRAYDILHDVFTWNHGTCRANGLPWRWLGRDQEERCFYQAGDQYCCIIRAVIWSMGKEVSRRD